MDNKSHIDSIGCVQYIDIAKELSPIHVNIFCIKRLNLLRTRTKKKRERERARSYIDVLYDENLVVEYIVNAQHSTHREQHSTQGAIVRSELNCANN